MDLDARLRGHDDMNSYETLLLKFNLLFLNIFK